MDLVGHVARATRRTIIVFLTSRDPILGTAFSHDLRQHTVRGLLHHHYRGSLQVRVRGLSVVLRPRDGPCLPRLASAFCHRPSFEPEEQFGLLRLSLVFGDLDQRSVATVHVVFKKNKRPLNVPCGDPRAALVSGDVLGAISLSKLMYL